jgi:protein tyrosine/serine phosphatase
VFALRGARRYQYPSVILFALMLAGPSAAAAADTGSADERAEALSKITIDNFGQVNESYYRGAQPKGNDYASLARVGIKTVIDLTRGGELGEQKEVEGAGMHFFRIPMTTSDRPDQNAVVQFLKLVNDPANQPVYVHCQGGRHRTGVMTAVYRLTHDNWTAERAFAEMRQYQFDKGFGHGALKQFMFDYYEKLKRTITVSTPE